MLPPLNESKTQMLPQDDVETLKKTDFLSDLKGIESLALCCPSTAIKHNIFRG